MYAPLNLKNYKKADSKKQCMKEWINCQVSEVINETHDTNTLRLELEEPMPFIAGQFVMVGFREGKLKDDIKAARAFSISSSTANKSRIDITVREFSQGLVSPELMRCKQGAKLKVRGPYGSFNYSPKSEEDVVLIGAGSGVAPLIGILKEINEFRPRTNTTFIYSDKTEKDIIAKQFINSLSLNNAKKIITLTRENGNNGWKGEYGRIDETMINKYIEDIRNKLFYICGPPEMVNNIADILKRKGVNEGKIKTEKYE